MVSVSVIIPTYHRSEFLQGSIRTALDQTVDDIEVIVVNDDPNDDKTVDILNSFRNDSRVQVIHNEDRQGISASRNQAAKAADGEYLCILDDDDRWKRDKVERQLELFDENGDEYGVIYTGGEIWTDRERSRVVKEFSPPGSRIGDIYPGILSKWGMAPHSGHMIRRKAFESVGGFDENLTHGEDWDLSIRLAKEGHKFDAVDDPLTIRLSHDDNTSSNRAHIEQRKYIIDKYSKEILSKDKIRSEFFGKWHQERGFDDLESNRHLSAIRELWISIGYRPTKTRIVLFGVSIMGPPIFNILSKARQRLRAI